MKLGILISVLLIACLTSCSSSESAQQEVNTDENYGIVGFEDGSFIVQQFLCNRANRENSMSVVITTKRRIINVSAKVIHRIAVVSLSI